MRPFLNNRAWRFFAVCLLGYFGAAFAQPPAEFQTSHPRSPVTLVVGFPPGGAVDLIARELARELQTVWNQPVVVSNKPGSGSMIAAETVARAEPDGHTFLLASDSSIVVIPFLQDKMTYDPLADLRPVGLVATIPMMLVAHPSMRVKSIADLVAVAKADPGRIDYASFGFGTSHHLSMERLQSAADIQLNHIPYGSMSPVQDVLAGHVPLMWSGVSSAVANIQAGKLTPLAVGSTERSPLLPDVPTVAEAGYSGFETSIWVGLMAPAGVPKGLVDKISRELQKVVTSFAYQERIHAQGNLPRASTVSEFDDVIRADYARNKSLFGRLSAPK